MAAPCNKREERASPYLPPNSWLWAFLTLSVRCNALDAYKSVMEQNFTYIQHVATSIKFKANFAATSNSPSHFFHHGKLLVRHELFYVRRSSLPMHCHSPSVIQDKKNLWDMDQAGVIRCVRGLPRQPDKPDASGWPGVISENTLLMSLFLFYHYFYSFPALLRLSFALCLDCSAQSSQTPRSALWSLSAEEPVS